MDIAFDSPKLEKLCNSRKALVKAYGDVCAKKVRQRLDDMNAATTLEVCRKLPGRYHELTGDRKGQIACDLEHPKRLVFKPSQDDNSDEAKEQTEETDEASGQKDDDSDEKGEQSGNQDQGLDWSKVTAVIILEIVDYHG